MLFMLDLKEFLLRNGSIYTVRRYRAEDVLVTVKDVGVCRRTFVAEVESVTDLLDYVHSSGFASATDWWDKIAYFIPATGRKYLYKVEVVKPSTTRLSDDRSNG